MKGTIFRHIHSGSIAGTWKTTNTAIIKGDKVILNNEIFDVIDRTWINETMLIVLVDSIIKPTLKEEFECINAQSFGQVFASGGS